MAVCGVRGLVPPDWEPLCGCPAPPLAAVVLVVEWGPELPPAFDMVERSRWSIWTLLAARPGRPLAMFEAVLIAPPVVIAAEEPATAPAPAVATAPAAAPPIFAGFIAPARTCSLIRIAALLLRRIIIFCALAAK